MPYYHATYRDRIPSILTSGLGGEGMDANWPGADRGVYLAEDPTHAVFVMVDWFMQTAEFSHSPKDFIDSLVIILIDDSRVPRQRLGPDPSIHIDGVWLYRGIIDVRNMPVLELDQVMPKTDKADINETRDWMRRKWGRSIDEYGR